MMAVNIKLSYPELVVNVKTKSGQYTQQHLMADPEKDIVMIDFTMSDGAKTTTLIDFSKVFSTRHVLYSYLYYHMNCKIKTFTQSMVCGNTDRVHQLNFQLDCLNFLIFCSTKQRTNQIACFYCCCIGLTLLNYTSYLLLMYHYITINYFNMKL